MLLESKPTRCKACNARVYYLGNGKYYCRTCGFETLDDYGKMKKFVRENPEYTVVYASQVTGVRPEIIEQFAQKGDFEVPEESPYFLSCEKCGCSIREGRYCSFCVYEIAGELKNMFNEDKRMRRRL